MISSADADFSNQRCISDCRLALGRHPSTQLQCLMAINVLSLEMTYDFLVFSLQVAFSFFNEENSIQILHRNLFV